MNESLLLLRRVGARSTLLNITVSWSRAFLPDCRVPKREVPLRQEAFDVAEVLAPKLRSVPEPRVDRFFGYVDELRGRPLPDVGLPSGKVRFTLFDQGEEIRTRRIWTKCITPTRATRTFASRVVSFKGILERLPRLNRIKDVTDFQVIDFADGIRARAE